MKRSSIFVWVLLAASLLVFFTNSVVYGMVSVFHVRLTPAFWLLSALSILAWIVCIFLVMRMVRTYEKGRPILSGLVVFALLPLVAVLGYQLGAVQPEGGVLYNLLESLQLHGGKRTICNLGYNPYGYDSGCAPSEQ